jgi:hypothetical protein
MRVIDWRIRLAGEVGGRTPADSRAAGGRVLPGKYYVRRDLFLGLEFG